MTKNKKNKNSGFTLIELTVSMFIIALISGIMLVNYNSTNKRTKLNLATQKLASDIRLAQSKALGLTKFGGSIPAGGWGIHFVKDADNYIIFADSGNKIYDLGEENQASGGQTINLPAGVFIDSIDVANIVDIVFLSPAPITYINGNPSNEVEITLSDDNTTKTVMVNFFGLVDVIN